MIINVLDRKKLTSEVFKERKFNEDNLTKIREAIKDVSMSYGIAAALEFKESQKFPNATELSASLRDDKTHGLLLLKCFKEWLSNNSEEDVTFKHHSNLILMHGPLLQFYDSVRRMVMDMDEK